MGKIVDLWEGNSVTNWGAAAKELDLAILRTQYGANKLDQSFYSHASNCNDHGVIFHPYAFGLYVSVDDAENEANVFLSRIAKVNLPVKIVWIDVEKVTTKNPADIVPATQRFIDVCRKAGYKVGMYTGHAFYFDHNMSKVDCDFLWIPRYPSNDTGQPTGLKPAMACDIWQYTENGSLSGVSGAVDLNMLVGHTTVDVFKGVAANP